MPRFPYRIPPKGEDAVADRIRERRAASGRDITPLDGTLLHASSVADGWNSLLGSIRTKTSLTDDLRELLILRVAAHNSATFEWEHHEHVGRAGGLTVPQLAVIGDVTRTPLSPLSSASTEPLSPLQSAALAFADTMTKEIKVPDAVFDQLKQEFQRAGSSAKRAGYEGAGVEQQMVEATSTVACYNMVSRFLVALDVDDKARVFLPQPAVNPVYVPVPSPGSVKADVTLYAQISVAGADKPWLAFVNSLLTDLSLWRTTFAALRESYNLIVYDQRGHGRSSIPAEPCTIAQLADDLAILLDHLGVKKLKAVVGVSQGGATALAFGLRHSDRCDAVVACDTQPASPAANKAAWDERIALARKDGMPALARATASRWFPEGSDYRAEGKCGKVVLDMIENTSVDGFERGARALQDYDLLSAGLVAALKQKKVMLIAGKKDGKLPETLGKLAKQIRAEGGQATFEAVEGSGHLPMLDAGDKFVGLLGRFLAGF